MSSSTEVQSDCSIWRACSHAITSAPLPSNSITLSRFSHSIAMQIGVILEMSLQSIPTFRPKSYCRRRLKQFSNLSLSPWFLSLTQAHQWNLVCYLLFLRPKSAFCLFSNISNTAKFPLRTVACIKGMPVTRFLVFLSAPLSRRSLTNCLRFFIWQAISSREEW